MDRLSDFERLTAEIKSLKESLKEKIDKVLSRSVKEGSETAEEKKEQSEIAEEGNEDGDNVLVSSLEDEIDRKEEEVLAASCRLLNVSFYC